MLRQQQGFSLIELVIFIVIISLVSGSLLMGLNQSMLYSNISRQIPAASFLASARMEIIMMNRVVNGYSTLNDPCTVTPILAICTPLSTYATSNSLTVASTLSGSNPVTVTVTVTGAGNATLSTSIYNYENN